MTRLQSDPVLQRSLPFAVLQPDLNMTREFGGVGRLVVERLVGLRV